MRSSRRWAEWLPSEVKELEKREPARGALPGRAKARPYKFRSVQRDLFVEWARGFSASRGHGLVALGANLEQK